MYGPCKHRHLASSTPCPECAAEARGRREAILGLAAGLGSPLQEVFTDTDVFLVRRSETFGFTEGGLELYQDPETNVIVVLFGKPGRRVKIGRLEPYQAEDDPEMTGWRPITEGTEYSNVCGGEPGRALAWLIKEQAAVIVDLMRVELEGG